jgi:hypothetical protein
MLDNQLRHGRFTSSENYKLLTVGKREMTESELLEHRKNNPKSKSKLIEDGFGQAALTYIKEKSMEVRLGRTLSNESNARPLQWGKCCEAVAFSKLDTSYTLQSDVTVVHPNVGYWSGTPDLVKHVTYRRKKSGDIKCPMTLKSFCDLVDNFKRYGIQGVRDNHDDGEKYYWQIVSNAVLLELEYHCEITEGELVVYCPYQKDLIAVKAEAETWGFQWIVFGADCELPYLIEGGYYQDINTLTFDIPKSDKDLLRTNIIKAQLLLEEMNIDIKGYSSFMVSHDNEVNITLTEPIITN